jgi:hypothetical protein
MKRIADQIWAALRNTFTKEAPAKETGKEYLRRYSDPSWDSNYIIPDRTRRIYNEVNLREERSQEAESAKAFNNRPAEFQYC